MGRRRERGDGEEGQHTRTVSAIQQRQTTWDSADMEGVCVRQRAQHSSCALHGQSSIFCKAQLRKENSTVFLDTVEAFPFAGVRRDVRQSTRADVQACGTVRCSAVRTHGSALFAFYPLLDGEKSGQKFSFSGSAHRISFLRPNTALWYWCCKATVQQTVLTGMYAPPQRYCQTPWSDRHGKDSRTRFLFSLEYENRSSEIVEKRDEGQRPFAGMCTERSRCRRASTESSTHTECYVYMGRATAWRIRPPKIMIVLRCIDLCERHSRVPRGCGAPVTVDLYTYLQHGCGLLPFTTAEPCV